jgi:hypothetical protein
VAQLLPAEARYCSPGVVLRQCVAGLDQPAGAVAQAVFVDAGAEAAREQRLVVAHLAEDRQRAFDIEANGSRPGPGVGFGRRGLQLRAIRWRRGTRGEHERHRQADESPQ